MISYSLQKTFDIPNNHLINHGEKTDDLKKKDDLLIFNLQDHLRPELMPKLIDMINQLNGVENIFVANIGVNMFHAAPNFSISKKVVDFLKHTSQNSQIGVRGDFTRSLLRSIGIDNIIVNGCPSFWAMKIPVNEIYKKSLINLDKVDNEKLNILIGGDVVPQDHINTSYLCQGDYDSVQALNAIKNHNLVLNEFGYYGENVPFFFDHWEKEIILSQLLIPFEPTIQLFEVISNYDLYLGSRVHGCITSMNSGIPAVCTNYDFRAIEMCNALNIPHISQFPGFIINNLWLQTLSERSSLLLQDYEKQREEKYLNIVKKIKNTNYLALP